MKAIILISKYQNQTIMKELRLSFALCLTLLVLAFSVSCEEAPVIDEGVTIIKEADTKFENLYEPLKP
jgi:hypothetical protein